MVQENTREKKPRLTLREMSEKGMFPMPIPQQLAFISDFLGSYYNPRETLAADLEAGIISEKTRKTSEEQVEKIETLTYIMYSRLRASFYRVASNYVGDNNLAGERFLKKARNAKASAEKYFH